MVRFGPLRKGCPLAGAGISEGSYEVDSGRAWKKHAGCWKLLPPLVDGTVAWGHGWEQEQTRRDEHPLRLQSGAQHQAAAQGREP